MAGPSGSNIGLYTGPLFLSCLFSYFLVGCCFIQVVCFFQITPICRRHAYGITLVSVTLTVELVGLALASMGTYHILCIALPSGDFTFKLPLIALGLVALSTFTTTCVQAHFAMRVRFLSRGHWAGSTVAALVVSLCLAQFSAGVGIAYFGAASKSDLGRLAHDVHHRRVLMVWFISRTLADIVNTIALVFIYVTFRKNTERQQSKSWLNNLILHTVENGALSSIAAILHFSFYLGQPNSLVHVAIAFVSARLYSNVLLASLNASRQVQRSLATNTDFSDDMSGSSTGSRALGVPVSPSGLPSMIVQGHSPFPNSQYTGMIGTRTEVVEFTRIETSMTSGSGERSFVERSVDARGHGDAPPTKR